MSPTDRATPGVFITERSAFPMRSPASRRRSRPSSAIRRKPSRAAGARISRRCSSTRWRSSRRRSARRSRPPTTSWRRPLPDTVSTSPPRDGTRPRRRSPRNTMRSSAQAGAFNLYNSLRLFYANGGGPCYVVSVGDYTDDGRAPGGVAIDAGKLTQGLTAIGAQAGPTMLAVPDAVLLAAGCDAGPRLAGVRGLQRARAGDAGAVRRVAGPGRDPGRLRRGRAQAGPERRGIQQRPGLSGRDFPERSRRQLARLRDGLFPVPPNDSGPAGRGRLPQLQHRQGRSARAAARHPDRHGGAALSGHVPARRGPGGQREPAIPARSRS